MDRQEEKVEKMKKEGFEIVIWERDKVCMVRMQKEGNREYCEVYKNGSSIIFE